MTAVLPQPQPQPEITPTLPTANAAAIACQWPHFDGITYHRCGPDQWDRIAQIAIEVAIFEKAHDDFWATYSGTWEDVASRIAYLIAHRPDMPNWEIIGQALTDGLPK